MTILDPFKILAEQTRSNAESIRIAAQSQPDAVRGEALASALRLEDVATRLEALVAETQPKLASLDDAPEGTLKHELALIREEMVGGADYHRKREKEAKSGSLHVAFASSLDSLATRLASILDNAKFQYAFRVEAPGDARIFAELFVDWSGETHFTCHTKDDDFNATREAFQKFRVLLDQQLANEAACPLFTPPALASVFVQGRPVASVEEERLMLRVFLLIIPPCDDCKTRQCLPHVRSWLRAAFKARHVGNPPSGCGNIGLDTPLFTY